ncbi:Homeodomain-like protein [Cynara cardunculus var. scolymus]|uniref:Homeodomain-like protein n=1 Tax=Cynara cardunculus var. scolymus TaxID=59895 RepID=A0A103YAW5_CYNCS|nr:Homeodomain-like protein [Cynara cardunculus var. scolymus]
MGRQPCCEKNGLRRGPWTIDEDHKLMTFILNNGIQCWRLVPKLAEKPDILNDKTPTIEDIGLMMMSHDHDHEDHHHRLESLNTCFELELPQNWIDNPGFQWDVFNDPGLGFH